MLALKLSTSAAVVIAALGVKSDAYTGLEHALEHSSGNGSYLTGTLKSKAGSSRYLADGYTQLDWSWRRQELSQPDSVHRFAGRLTPRRVQTAVT
ncbi:hypothetical protein ACFWBR_24875 [Streptomyces sp. NPDC060006]|uniref:hypothetical protein n=1 Tax=unclassified Streptomyces TaxID=2593676 RepID=UPI0036CAD066